MKSVFTKSNSLELLLRAALFVDYKYGYLSEESRSSFNKLIEKKTSKDDKRKYLENVLNVLEPLHIITCFYRHFAPNKSEEEDFVNKIF